MQGRKDRNKTPQSNSLKTRRGCRNRGRITKGPNKKAGNRVDEYTKRTGKDQRWTD